MRKHMTKLIPASRDEDGHVVIWKTPYNHDTDYESERTALECKDPSKTQQSFKDQVDINNIVATVLRTGDSPQVPAPLQYADLSTMEDYHTMQTKLAETNALFYRLPPAVRASYQNDPGQWLEHVTSSIENGDLDPLREMGLDMASVDKQIAELKAQAEDERAATRAAQKAAEKGGTTPGAPAPEPPKQEGKPPAT